LDTGLAAYDDFFWQEVYDKYQVSSTSYDDLVFEESMFDGIDPSVKLSHSWSKLREIYKALVKDYEVIHDNHKKSGNHDDFINFCQNKGEVYYLYLWLQAKPDVTNIVAPDLPEEVFFESTNTPFRRPSPTGSNTTRQTLVERLNALAAARMPDPNQAKLTEEKVKAQVSTQCDDVVKRLLETK
jgi:hypothetical protein